MVVISQLTHSGGSTYWGHGSFGIAEPGSRYALKVCRGGRYLDWQGQPIETILRAAVFRTRREAKQYVDQYLS